MSRKTVLITGASAGIGAACAKSLAQCRYDIALNYRTDTKRAEQTAEIARAAGARVHLVQADVADPDAIEPMFAAIDDVFGKLDALVNNAGIVAPGARVDQMDAARISRVMDVNVTGAFLVAGAAVRRMSRRYGGTGGAIVNISSAAARLASPGEYVDYAASKAALDILTKGLSLEVADEGIRVNGVRPGIIDTEIHAKGGAPDRVARLSGNVPMKRAGQPGEIADTVVWLLSDAASYITGSQIDVSGGR